MDKLQVLNQINQTEVFKKHKEGIMGEMFASQCGY